MGSSWFADLGPPFGVMYCIKCECVPVSITILYLFINIEKNKSVLYGFPWKQEKLIQRLPSLLACQAVSQPISHTQMKNKNILRQNCFNKLLYIFRVFSSSSFHFFLIKIKWSSNKRAKNVDWISLKYIFWERKSQQMSENFYYSYYTFRRSSLLAMMVDG